MTESPENRKDPINKSEALIPSLYEPPGLRRIMPADKKKVQSRQREKEQGQETTKVEETEPDPEKEEDGLESKVDLKPSNQTQVKPPKSFKSMFGGLLI